jgi:hypothetical protein
MYCCSGGCSMDETSALQMQMMQTTDVTRVRPGNTTSIPHSFLFNHKRILGWRDQARAAGTTFNKYFSPFINCPLYMPTVR